MHRRPEEINETTKQWVRHRGLKLTQRLSNATFLPPQRGYDEPAILSYAISSFCPTSADGLHSYYLSRSPVREHSNKAVELSRMYLLEELAVICCLAQDSPCTFVHPKSLTILEEIAEGKHPYLPPALQQIDYVELKLKRR